MDTWRLIDTGTGTAAWNMAVDEALLESSGQSGIPVLRLYGWERSLSFGKYSQPYECLDMRRVEKAGVACVRRSSGGGVLVHGDDLSYAILLPQGRIKGVRENYRHWCGFLLHLYAELGLRAGFAEGRGEGRSAICLAGSEPDDILIDGKKMGGNAQRHTTRALLQHGTIPLGIDRRFFEPLFSGDSGLGNAATLKDFGVDTARQPLGEMVAESFRRTFGITFSAGGLDSAEEERARSLMECKYAQRGWTFDGKQTMAQA